MRTRTDVLFCGGDFLSSVKVCRASCPLFSHYFVSKIFWHNTVRTVVVASPPFISSSEGVLSTPRDFPAFILRTATSASFLKTDRLLARVSRWLFANSRSLHPLLFVSPMPNLPVVPAQCWYVSGPTLAFQSP